MKDLDAYLGLERRHKNAEPNPGRRTKDRRGSLANEDGGGKGGLIGLVFAALVVGGAGTYVSTIQNTREKAQQTAADLSRFQAEVVGGQALTNLKVDRLTEEVRDLAREVKALRERRLR